MYDGATQYALSTYKFTGKERDPESNLDYFGPRYNSSSLGRFMSPDPVGPSMLQGTALLAHQLAPQDWNKYSYALDNPTTLTDPTGLNACNGNDPSQTDCNVVIVIQDRTKDKNGNYNDQFTNVKNSKNYNATATVYINGKRQKTTYLIRTTPSSSKYGTLKAGTYSGEIVYHKGTYAAIRLTGNFMAQGTSPALGGMDPLTGKSYISDAEIHRAGLHNETGMYWDKNTKSLQGISQGCSVVCTSQYRSFQHATGLIAPEPQTAFTVLLVATANRGK